MKIKRALISVSDKTGLAEFAEELKSFNVHILSTGGTAKMLREKDIEVEDVSNYTGYPEMMDGRVKTLHPKIHGALLGLRENSEHVNAMKQNKIIPIDMVVVNLYPFVKTIESGCSFDEAIENIDIGGPSMIRSAAKNHKYVTVITDPSDYSTVLSEMKSSNGEVSETTNRKLAVKVYKQTSEYDARIAAYLS